jgi:hypothetical protein
MPLAHTLQSIAHELRRDGHVSRAQIILSAIDRLDTLQDENETLKQETINMAHTLTQTVKVLNDALAAKDLKIADLTKQLADAQANARTPDEAAAEAQLIALADTLDPQPA